MVRKVRITKQKNASADGLNTRLYEVGEEHEIGSKDMPEALAESLIEAECAEEMPKSAIHVSVASAQEGKKLEDAPKVGRPRLPGPSEIKGK